MKLFSSSPLSLIFSSLTFGCFFRQQQSSFEQHLVHYFLHLSDAQAQHLLLVLVVHCKHFKADYWHPAFVQQHSLHEEQQLAHF